VGGQISDGPWDHVIEEPGLPSWPIQIGAAGMRDLAALRRYPVDAFTQDLRVLVRFSSETSMAEGYAVEIGAEIAAGYATARYDFIRASRWNAEAARYDLDGDEAIFPERVCKRLNLDRHSDRVVDLMIWACEFEQQVQPSSVKLHGLTDLVAVTRWSLRGRSAIIDEREREAKQERGLSRDDQAHEFGVKPDSLRRHQNRIAVVVESVRTASGSAPRSQSKAILGPPPVQT
jgi:hypothetical protein